MARPKGSKNKKKRNNTDSTLNKVISQLKEAGISSADLAKRYNKGKSVTAGVLVDIFEKYRPELEKMQVKNTRGRYAGQLRPAKPDELISAFVEKISAEIGKSTQAGSILADLKGAASIKLTF